MNYVALSDEETCAIFAEQFTDSLADLQDTPRQLQVLKRIHAVLESASPQYFIEERVEGCEELQVIRAGNDLRIYCRLVLGIPRVNKEYNVLYALYVDPHEYRSAVLQRLDDAAKDLLTEATSLDDVTDVEAYLEEMHAFYAEDIQERIDRAC